MVSVPCAILRAEEFDLAFRVAAALEAKGGILVDDDFGEIGDLAAWLDVAAFGFLVGI
jgi:hypothetical protein